MSSSVVRSVGVICRNCLLVGFGLIGLVTVATLIWVAFV